MEWEEKLRKCVSWTVVVAAGIFTSAVFLIIVLACIDGFFDEVALEHTPSVIGLPVAAIASLVLVLLLRTMTGDIEMKVLGLEFKGAGGPILMWILCFLAMTLAIDKTWDLDKGEAANQARPHIEKNN